ncbi:MAG: hypothetical protein ACOY90_02525 [Candidatus Zhuqueibacterota bacterium]
MVRIKQLFSIIITLLILGCASQQAGLKFSSPDVDVHKKVNDFIDLTKNDQKLVRKIEKAKGFSAMGVMGEVLPLLQQKNGLKTVIVKDLLAIMDSSENDAKRMEAWKGFSVILKNIDLEKLKQLKGETESNVAYSIAAKYEGILFTNKPKQAFGYINMTYDMLKEKVSQVSGKETNDEVKAQSILVMDKFK